MSCPSPGRLVIRPPRRRTTSRRSSAPGPLEWPAGTSSSQGQTAMAFGPSSELPWSWHLMPTGLMYRSYLAGIKEPRIGSAWLTDSQLGPHHDTRLDTDAPGTVWDATLGGRVGILRYGTPNAYRPEGFQVDLLGSRAAAESLWIQQPRAVDRLYRWHPRYLCARQMAIQNWL